MDLQNQINEVIKKAKNDAHSEVIKKINGLNLLNENDLFSLLIKVKKNYLKSLGSEYYLIKNITSNIANNKQIDRISEFYKNNRFLYTLEDKIDKYIEELYKCTKIEFTYILYENFINKINNTKETNYKIPTFDDIEIFLLNEKIKIDLENKTLRKTNLDFYKKISKLQNKKVSLKEDYNDIKRELNVLKRELKNKEYIINEIYKPFLYKIDTAAYCNQFNNTFWGDNYPALKVFYDFLWKNSAIEIGWSYFSELMSVENKEPIQIYCKKITKTRFGYLLYNIKKFFLPEFITKKNTYKNWIQSKMRIEDNFISDSYINKYATESVINDKRIDEYKDVLDNLVIDIAQKYK